MYRTCGLCRYWSQRVAQSIGCEPIEALCLSKRGPKRQRMTTEDASCEAWADNRHGSVDEDGVLARYEEEGEGA